MIYLWGAVYAILCTQLECHWCWLKIRRGSKQGKVQRKRFGLGWRDVWPEFSCVTPPPSRVACLQEKKYILITFVFFSVLQILTPTSAWWLELPPWTPWCLASVWCLHPSLRTYQLLKRSSTARAAPCSPPIPVSQNVTLILHEPPAEAWLLPEYHLKDQTGFYTESH